MMRIRFLWLTALFLVLLTALGRPGDWLTAPGAAALVLPNTTTTISPTPPPTTTALPSPTPSPTPSPSPTSTPQVNVKRVWLKSIAAESALTGVHSSGAATSKSDTVTILGDCANGLHMRLRGTDKQGRIVEVEYLTIGSGFWSRSRQAGHPWSTWKKAPGYNADIFIAFAGILCPQTTAREYAKLSPARAKRLVKDMGTATIGDRLTYRLRLPVQNGHTDIFVDSTTLYWVRMLSVDTKAKERLDISYSRFNDVTLHAPK